MRVVRILRKTINNIQYADAIATVAQNIEDFQLLLLVLVGGDGFLLYLKNYSYIP